jgi:hypothetical protein
LKPISFIDNQWRYLELAIHFSSSHQLKFVPWPRTKTKKNLIKYYDPVLQIGFKPYFNMNKRLGCLHLHMIISWDWIPKVHLLFSRNKTKNESLTNQSQRIHSKRNKASQTCWHCQKNKEDFVHLPTVSTVWTPKKSISI